MNIYRCIADGVHVLGILVLFAKIMLSKSSVQGISGKSQFLFALTYLARYSDLIMYSLGSYGTIYDNYNTSFKIFFIISSILAVALIFIPFRKFYENKFDTLWIETLIVPTTILTIVLKYNEVFIEVNNGLSLIDILWTWSIFMEALALVPQFYMIWRGGRIDSYIFLYIFSIFLYRGFYLINWAYRYKAENYYEPIATYGGILGTFINFIGLLIVLELILSGKRTVSSNSNENKKGSIYTLPFINQVHLKGLSSFKHTKKNLLIPNEFGPYNPELSVPILQEDYNDEKIHNLKNKLFIA